MSLLFVLLNLMKDSIKIKKETMPLTIKFVSVRLVSVFASKNKSAITKPRFFVVVKLMLNAIAKGVIIERMLAFASKNIAKKIKR